MNNIFKNLGVEIRIDGEEAFLKIKETLTRIGVASRKSNTLFQSCHILHKKDKETDLSRYVIIHFKELFLLDGKSANFSEEDKGRRNKIVELLQDWGLITVMEKDKILQPMASMNQIKVLNFNEKKDWTLTQKYSIGKRKN